jgi:glycosyltransferase involved in cell wall biosynthesis
VRRGHSVTQAALYRPSPGSAPLAFAAGERIELQGKVKGRLEIGVLKNLLILLRRMRPDIVQANGFHALKYASLCKQISRGRWELIYRNISLASGWVQSRPQRIWGTWLCRQVHFVASVSAESAADFGRTYAVPNERLVVVRRGVDIPSDSLRDEQHRRLCALAGCGPDTQFVGHIGGFTEEKNHHGLIEAFRRLRQIAPMARLVLLGQGDMFAQIQDQVRTSGLDDSVRLLGYRADARELSAAFDVLLLPSRIEGIPGVVLEAAARRVPSVCTTVGGVAEAVIDGQTGLLVTAGDMRALADAAGRFLSDESFRRRAGEAAYIFVREHYSMDRAVGEFEQLYRSALNDEPGVAVGCVNARLEKKLVAQRDV